MAETFFIKSSKDQEKVEELERSWSDLPPELLSLILSHLFAGESSIFHSVCRSWRSITSAIQPLPPPADSPHSKSPCLMILNHHICKFFHPVYNNAYHMHIPELSDARIRFSKYGWLLMSQWDDSVFFFFNPFTKVRIEFPSPPIRCGFGTMCFSSPPTSLDCLVVGLSFSSMIKTEIGIIKRGEEGWTIRDFENNQSFAIANCCPILYNGRYYCLGASGNIGVFEFKDNECSWTVCTKPLKRRLRDSLCQSFMVESDGELLAVFLVHEERRVCVFRLNPSEMVWRTVQSLGDKMLYVSIKASFSETAVVRGMGNKIYFPMFNGNNGVFYSLATGKYHSFVGGHSSRSFFKTNELRNLTWIKPIFASACNDEFSEKTSANWVVTT